MFLPKRLVKFILFKVRWKGILLFKWSTEISSSSHFEGMNQLHKNVTFSGFLGYGSYIGPNSYINGNIGRFTSIGPNVKCNNGMHPYLPPFASTSPSFYSLNKNKAQNGATFAKEQTFIEFKYADKQNKYAVIIGNDCWIGENVFITGGIHINNGAVILANAVVTKNIPPYAIVGGVPAQIIGYRYNNDTITFLEKIQWWNNDKTWFEKNWRLLNDIDKLKAYYDELSIQNNQ